MLAIITNLLTNIPPSPHPHSHPRKKIFQISWYWNIQEKVGDKPKKFPPGVTRSNQTHPPPLSLPNYDIICVLDPKRDMAINDTFLTSFNVQILNSSLFINNLTFDKLLN